MATESAATGEQFFPHFAIGAGFETDFVVFGGAKNTTGNGVLSFIGKDGIPLSLQYGTRTR